MDTNLIGNNGLGITIATDAYMPLYVAGNGFDTTQSAYSANVMPVAGTLQNFYLQCDTGPGAGITRTFWVVKNGTTTGMSIALTGSGTGAGVSSGSDTVDTVSFGVGDLLSIHSTATSTPTSTGAIRWTFNAHTTTPNQSMVLATNGGISLSPTSTSYNVVSGRGLDTNSSNNVQQVMPTSGTLKNAILVLSLGPGTGTSYTATLFQNGSATSISMTISGSATSATDTSHTVSVSPGDVLYWAIVPSGTPVSRGLSISMEFDPAINGESVHMYGNTATDVNSGVRYSSVTASNETAFTSSEPIKQVLTQSAVWQKLYVNLVAAPGAGASWEVQLSVGGAPGSPNVTISGSNTTGNDPNNAIGTIGETVAMVLTPTNSPATSKLSWGVVSYMPPAGSPANSNFLSFI